MTSGFHPNERFSIASLLKSASNYPIAKGDLPGHPFHGNQYQEGQSDGSTQLNEHQRVNPSDREAVKEYKRQYARGWRSGGAEGALDRADDRNEPDAWYDGYHDSGERPRFVNQSGFHRITGEKVF